MDIKFKIWDNLKKDWLKGKTVVANFKLNSDGIGEFSNFPENPLGHTYVFWTGLKDKNGKDIYFGDWVKITKNAKTHTGQIMYRASGYPGIIICPMYHEGKFFYLDVEEDGDGYVEKDCEVIGNIYENP